MCITTEVVKTVAESRLVASRRKHVNKSNASKAGNQTILVQVRILLLPQPLEACKAIAQSLYSLRVACLNVQLTRLKEAEEL